MSSILEVQDVTKVYGGRGLTTNALNNISFDVAEGEFLGMMGPSGSGKTTMLNCISTIDSVTSGHISIDGTDITTLSEKQLSTFRREKLGFIFQDFNLLDTLTGYENIALALSICGIDYDMLKTRVNAIAEVLQIDDILHKYPYEMSGGQKQRVATARAIVTQPSLILADEPTGALDSRTSRTMLESFVQMNYEMDATLLMVTHDAFAASYCSRILFLRDGRIYDELIRKNETRTEFFNKIIEVVSILGGDSADAV
ncbi:MAG: ABC transporter ATP-binding protein [Christensenella sp.]|nr:ABC transporter ATP-binding protein [Christensenella sp.]